MSSELDALLTNLDTANNPTWPSPGQFHSDSIKHACIAELPLNQSTPFQPLLQPAAYSGLHKLADFATLEEEKKGKQASAADFNLVLHVNASKAQRRPWGRRHNRNDRAQVRTQKLSKAQEKERIMQAHRMSKMKRSKLRARKAYNWRQAYNRGAKTSVEIRSTWEAKANFLFTRLQKEELTGPVPTPTTLKAVGHLRAFDPLAGRISVQEKKKLVLNKESRGKSFYSTYTREDPIIQDFMKEDKAEIFITDKIMSLIMNSTRTVLSWDVVIIKKGNKIIFEKSSNQSRVDFMTVNESSKEPPQILDEAKNDKGQPLNTPDALSKENTMASLKFQQFVLKKPKDGKEPKQFDSLPFVQKGQTPAPVSFFYQQFNLNGKKIICRCEVDGYEKTGNREKYLTIRALMEYQKKNREDFATLLDTAPGRVLTEQVRNNTGKIARWVTQAMLAGSEELKIGYVSRAMAKNNQRHYILGVQSYATRGLAMQIDVKGKSMWGIFAHYLNEIEKLEEGKYTLIKLANKNVVQLYRISSTYCGTLVFRKNPDDQTKYDFLLLRDGDRTVLPTLRTDQSEKVLKTSIRTLRSELGIQDIHLTYANDFQHSSKSQDESSNEERTDVSLACMVTPEGVAEMRINERYSGYEWLTWNPPHSVDEDLDPILNSFYQFVKKQPSFEKAF